MNSTCPTQNSKAYPRNSESTAYSGSIKPFIDKSALIWTKNYLQFHWRNGSFSFTVFCFQCEIDENMYKIIVLENLIKTKRKNENVTLSIWAESQTSRITLNTPVLVSSVYVNLRCICNCLRSCTQGTSTSTGLGNSTVSLSVVSSSNNFNALKSLSPVNIHRCT